MFLFFLHDDPFCFLLLGTVGRSKSTPLRPAYCRTTTSFFLDSGGDVMEIDYGMAVLA